MVIFMKRIIAILWGMLMIFSSCNRSNASFLLENVNQNTIIYKSISQIYSEETVRKLIITKPTLQEFCSKLEIHIYKTYDSYHYVVLKLDSGLAIASFIDQDKDNPMDARFLHLIMIHFTANLSSDYFFTVIPETTSLQDIMQADPSDSAYPFLYAGSSKYPKYSMHFFESGDCYILYYDEHEIVTNMIHFTI